MLRSSRNMMAVAFLASAMHGQAFTSPSTAVRQKTSLDVMPPMIIGPMIKKMRAEKEAKNVPMATADEAKLAAPGLRVGGAAWRFPAVWPYDKTFFTPPADIPASAGEGQGNPLAGMLGGTQEAPQPEVEVEVLDVVKYWTEEKAEVRTDLDEEAVEKLKSHYSFYLKPGMSILEFGAAENSYLPDDIKPSRHVGVSLSPKLMGQNPSLTEKIVVDLNKAVEGRDVDSDDLRMLATEPFDVIIMTNTVDFLTNPREVFRSAWYLLKPGGIMLNSFTTGKAYPEKFDRAQTKMWKDFNDDQHMWISGSMFQFSAGDGWEGLKGFDISPESAKEAMESGPLDFMKKGKANNMYVVQATKGFQEETIDDAAPEKSIKSKMWMLPTMESRDKQLVVPRLARSYAKAHTEERKKAIADNILTLPAIYQALIKMDQFAFTFSMQSQLAADLVLDPMFKGNDAQILALKQGLGLRTPSTEFWQPIGENTGAMLIEDKINLLAYLVPRFGSENPAQDAALNDYGAALKPTFALIQSKCSGMAESDVQLLGTELLNAEILTPGRSTKEEFAAWLGAMSEEELKVILASRQMFKEEAKNELVAYRAQVAERERRQEEMRKLYQEQVEKARKERTMGFNPSTGKFQEIQKDSKK